MAEIMIMECCNNRPQCTTISGDATAYFYCPVCGRTSKSFSVSKKNGSYYECSNRKEMEEVIEYWNKDVSESEERKMKVSYKGFAGELLKLEREEKQRGGLASLSGGRSEPFFCYKLDIFDKEKDAKISFYDVLLSEVKFLGGEVTFG